MDENKTKEYTKSLDKLYENYKKQVKEYFEHKDEKFQIECRKVEKEISNELEQISTLKGILQFVQNINWEFIDQIDIESKIINILPKSNLPNTGIEIKSNQQEFWGESTGSNHYQNINPIQNNDTSKKCPFCFYNLKGTEVPEECEGCHKYVCHIHKSAFSGCDHLH